MTAIEQAKQLAASREYDKLEDLWTDLITEKDIDPQEYCRITDVVKEAGELERATLLLELLSDHHESQRAYDNVLKILKHMLQYHKESPQVRRKLISIYRKKHQNSLHVEDYLELSGLSKDDPIMKAIHKFEDYVQYDIGRYFFFERYGLGQVVDVNPEKREIIVDFEKKKKHFLTLDVARGVLTPVNEHHFLYQKKENPSSLKQLASDQPAELVILLLSSIRKPLTASEIKNHLEGIIDRADINRFWERTRKILEKHDHVKVSGRATKAYTFAASAEDKKDQAIDAFHRAGIQEKYLLAEEYSAKLPAIFETLLPHLKKLVNQIKDEHPGIAVDIMMLSDTQNTSSDSIQAICEILNSSIPEVILKDMANLEHQKKVLSMLRQENPAVWSKTATELIFVNDDFRLLDALADQLQDSPEQLEDIHHKILAMPKQYPKQFHWMLRKIAAGTLDEYLRPTLIPRLIDSLDYVSGVKAVVKEILSLTRFDALLSGAKIDEASRIRDAVGKSGTLTVFEKTNFMRIIEHYFPDLAEAKPDIVYTTHAALQRKQDELEQILTVEIPENKKEIGRAREFGDLSENFEYKAAKEKQDQLYERAKAIEADLLRVKLIEPDSMKTDRVGVGTAVVLKRAEGNSLITYQILGRWDTDLEKNIISNEAPLACTMMGKKVGDPVEIEGIAYVIDRIIKAGDLEETGRQ